MNDNFPKRLVDGTRRVVCGNFEEGTFEQRLIIIGCLTLSLVTAVATVTNFATGLYNMGWVTLVFCLVTLSFFTTARRGLFPRWLVPAIFVGAVLFSNLLWYFNYGSKGPTLIVITGVYVFYILISKRGTYLLPISLFLLNMLGLFLIEYHFPHLLGDYESDQLRSFDMYLGTAFAMILIFLATLSVKRNYELQYLRARSSDQLKTAFLANLSHEVRTPLNVISGFTSVIPEMDYQKEDMQKIHQIIHYNGIQLVNLVEDMIDLSKLEVDQLELFPEPVDLREMFDELNDNFRSYAATEQKRQLDFQYQLALNNPVVWADRNRLSQVLRHLIKNAMHFSDRGSICFGCREEAADIVFFVKDQGRGIKPEYEAFIFDSFVKCPSSETTIERGLGMGLYLSKRIVALMGGKMWFQSQHQKGSEFYFSIPRKQVPENDFR
ncbi:HAMP domain-containing sensor histidine kinase [Mangrovibacterium marinum]|uniref:histidine kinase n=1 Tax=Mangrovibacterium marinum TaxID=1639118 RepID=A0A2T5BZY2_9BACT|nr:HAMP domain-containing sensor histidine kinase [Mangrovibacterium marinum]PTN07869.1 signal transduction histidine kinase [Mangrovibacterium marinum]